MLREERGCDVVVALTHMRVPNDKALADSVAELDLVLGGHDHDYFPLSESMESGVPWIKSGTDFRELSLIRVERCASGEPRRVRVSAERREVNRLVPRDSDMEALVESYEERLGASMDRVVGFTAVALEGRFAKIRTEETNLGNWVADCMRFATKGADVALLNTGTLRVDAVVPAGAIRLKDLTDILPMPDETCLLALTDEQLLRALENGVSMHPKHEGRFPCISGAEFEFDQSAKPGSRVVPGSVKIHGEALSLGGTYRVVTKRYIADGRDGYSSLAEGKVLVSGEESPVLPTICRNHLKLLETLRIFHSKKSDDLVRRASAKFLRSSGRSTAALAVVDTEGGTAAAESRLGSGFEQRVSTHLLEHVGREGCAINPAVEGRIRRRVSRSVESATAVSA